MKYISMTIAYMLLTGIGMAIVACANEISGTGNTIKNSNKIENNASVSFPNLLK